MKNTMSQQLAAARKRWGSTNCGDEVAQDLIGMPLEHVLMVADLVSSRLLGYHAQRYAHLNNGQKRMNAGNVIRNAYRRADLS